MDEELRWHLLMTKKFEHQIAVAFELLRRKGIEPLLIKGWAAARYYPPDKPRFFGDVDLAVAASDYELASESIRQPDFAFLAIDLHKELRALDTVAWDDILSHSEVIEGSSIRVPCAEDHLRILCVHWLNDGGAYKERLWDIYYIIERGIETLDWNRVLDVVDPVRREWIKTVIAITHKYLGLDVSALPFADDVREVDPWIVRAIEKEWATDVRLLPMQTVLRDPKKLLQQIKKRIPPNPIQSTIEMGGRLDARKRFFYQIANYFQRWPPMKRRLSFAIAQLLRNGKR